MSWLKQNSERLTQLTDEAVQLSRSGAPDEDVQAKWQEAQKVADVIERHCRPRRGQ